MPEIFTIKTSDLVLKVSENVESERFDISKNEIFRPPHDLADSDLSLDETKECQSVNNRG